MGCDIHLFQEIKIKGVWHLHTPVRVIRNYKLFAKMAGVRNDFHIKPITAPRGLPADVSIVVKSYNQDWLQDGHSYSWLNFNELEQLILWKGLDNVDRYFEFFPADNFVRNSKIYKEPLPNHIEDVRWVFWFDN